MNIINMNKNKISLIILQSVFIVFVSLFLFSGCSDTIEGEVTENLRPIVQFVNIPPDGHSFSRNPEVYWIGSDPDGLIDYYRYHIAETLLVASNGGLDTYISNLSDTDWIQINIDQSIANPHTTKVIPLTADTLNPVSNPIAQYILLQAFDRENLGSIIAKKLFNRNDNPPETIILQNYQSSLPFVNSVLDGGIVTGIRMSWEGSDRKDYDEIGLTPPPFDYEWRLFGPFDDKVLDSINNFLVENVVVTSEAQVLHLDEADTLCHSVQRDTIINSVDTTITVEVCVITVFDSTYFADRESDLNYSIEQIMNVEDTLIANNLVSSSFNGIDEWVQNEKDTIYNVYKNSSSDTTVEFNYIFWVRSRDDALVKDLTPAFASFPVIDPRYERDIAIIDFRDVSKSYPNHPNYYKHVDTAKAFWYNIIHRWAATRTGDSEPIIFDTAFFTGEEIPDSSQINKTGIDYIMARRFTDGIPIKYLLKHKVLILYNESIENSGFVGATVNYKEILSAMDAGINVWATWRNPLNFDPKEPSFQFQAAPLDYLRYFGVISMTYSGWYGNAYFPDFSNFPQIPVTYRNEDFVGAYSIDESSWPTLEIDTALLHSRLVWFEKPGTEFQDPFAFEQLNWRDTLAALPEVNWAARAPGTEVMYLYKSLYGAEHVYDYEGAPVGHRLESNLFKTVHFNFTLLTIDSLQAQAASNEVLDWLYSRKLNSSTVQENRYNDAPNRISIEDARQRYAQRLIEQAEQRAISGE